MGIRETAAADIKAILEDKTTGFGWDITLTSPSNVSAAFVGFSTDVYREYDDDDRLVSLRAASIALSTLSLTAAGMALPEGIHSETSRPWVVEFADIEGNAGKFKVKESNPDRAAGVVVCHLEEYK